MHVGEGVVDRHHRRVHPYTDRERLPGPGGAFGDGEQLDGVPESPREFDVVGVDLLDPMPAGRRRPRTTSAEKAIDARIAAFEDASYPSTSADGSRSAYPSAASASASAVA